MAMEALKLTKCSSSLCRPPTLSSGIDSLSCLEEGVLSLKRNAHTDRIWQQELAKRQSADNECFRRKGLRPVFCVPVLVVVAFPCVYYYARDPAQFYFPSHADYFTYVASAFFLSALFTSIKIACTHLNLAYRTRHVLCQSWSCLSVACMKPLTLFLTTDDKDKRKHSVTWTIGSNSHMHRQRNSREGVQMYSNGDVYEGEFHQGCCSGSGVHHFYLSGTYEGDWVDGKFDGYGVQTWTRGSRYRGQYRQGLRDGHGVYRFYTGDVYSGEWSNGQSHGCGVQNCEDGSRYVGEFKWGIKHGFGYYHFRNGDTYAGEYFANKMHGYGIYNFSNGHRYEGAWHEGKRQGLGLYTFRNGETQAGYWHVGMLQAPSSQHPVPGLPVAVSRPKVLHIVQEARQAAAKAYKVPHIDERVNKAVAAANRAANAARVTAVKAAQKARG